MEKAKNADRATQDSLWQSCRALAAGIVKVGSVLTLDGGSIRSACGDLVKDLG